MLKKKIGFRGIKVFLTASYVICWISISTSFFDITNFYNEILLGNKITNINDTINFLRQLLNILVFPILVVIFVKNIKKINFKKEILFILASLYFLMQIPGLYLTDNSHMNFVFIISALNILLIFVIANIHYDKKKYKIFLIISLVMLIIISFLNYKTIVNFLNVELGSSLYTFFTSSETFFGKNSPRSTGSSRTFLLIFIISILIFHKFFEKHDYLKIFFYNIIATLVLLFQSRTTIFLLIIFIILNYFLKKKFSISNFFKYLVFYLMFPICLLYLTLHIKYNIYNDDNSKKEMSFIERTNSLNKNFRRPIDPATFSSGRFKDWTSILEKIDGSMFYGYGSQGDRHLINQTASNGLIYAISSSGIIGLIFFILFSLNCLLKIFNNLILFKEPYSNKSYLSALVIFLILLRSLLESSYAVFGVDFIIIFTFINYLNKLKTK